AVWFAYSPDRKGENPRQHLKLYKGALQADAYIEVAGDVRALHCGADTNDHGTPRSPTDIGGVLNDRQQEKHR
ncbi:hypothetical protein HDF16_005183, partial [Granulicella aggregans]|nr:hypothetical protein [Granulicella aggregans]